MYHFKHELSYLRSEFTWIKVKNALKTDQILFYSKFYKRPNYLVNGVVLKKLH